MARLVKTPPAVLQTQVQSLVGKIPWKRKWQPTPVLLPGKSHGQRSLEGCSPRGLKESNTTSRLYHHQMYSHWMIQWVPDPRTRRREEEAMGDGGRLQRCNYKPWDPLVPPEAGGDKQSPQRWGGMGLASGIVRG